MPKSKVIKFSDYFALPNPSLRTYFGSVVKGNDEVYTSPFAKGESTQHLLTEWNKVLVSIRDSWPTLYDFEIDLAKKVGPMSVRKPLSERLRDIDQYYEGVTIPSEPIERSAILATIKEFSSVRSLHVRSYQRTVDNMKLSTNSGSPFFAKRRNVVDDTVPCRLDVAGNSVSQHLPHATYKACAVLGWRGQEGGPRVTDTKQRVVWMFPFAVNVQELQVYQPLIESFQKFNLVPAWVSMESVDRKITDLFDTKAANDLIVCTDFSKFDQHFGTPLQEAARTILAAILTPSVQSEQWLRDVFPIKYMIPIAIDNNTILFGKHGMGSGSGGTNADETLAHRALQYEAAISSHSRLNPNSMCLGDDGILSYPGITVEDVVASYRKHGLEMNDSKQYASEQDCVYLRRWHHARYREGGICVGVYSTMRALGRLRYLERYYDPKVWGPKAVALRQLSIIENINHHPLREQFVQFCMKRDRYRLGIDIPGFLDNIVTEAKDLVEHIPDFLGYTKTLQNESDPIAGISKWWIVQYLKGYDRGQR